MANENQGVGASRKPFLQTRNICHSCYSGADWAVYSLAGSILSEYRMAAAKYKLSTTIRPD